MPCNLFPAVPKVGEKGYFARLVWYALGAESILTSHT